MTKLALFVAGLSILPFILTETHWLVTETGRIHSVTESLFSMAQPHDLVQFLKQEERVRRSDEAKHRLTSQKSLIRHHEQKDDPQIESRLMQTDPDCVLAGKPLAQQDLFLSTVVPLENFGMKMENHIGEVRKASKSDTPFPMCTAYPLPFSMASFEHVPAVRDRFNLSSAPEPGLSQIAFDSWINTTDFAFAVASAMRERPNDWLLYTLSSYYYRFIGDGSEAVECLRRALHLVPREYSVIPMLSLGNVLHQSSRSKDAAVVMDTAVSFNNSIAQLFFTAGHIYAVSLQYEKATDALERAAKLDGSLTLAKIHQAAVRCHQKLESALETQHQNLQKTLSELQSYQVRLKNFQTLHEEMLRHVVDSEQRQLSSLTYDHVTYGPLEGLTCNTTSSNGQTYIDCDIVDFVTYKRAKQEAIAATSSIKKQMSSEDSKSETEDNSSIPEETGSGSSASTTSDSEGSRYLESLEVYRNLQLSKPTKPKRYKASQGRQRATDYSWIGESLPSEEECKNAVHLSRFEQLPFLFLSPENKGFDVKEILTEQLNLNDTYGHPLPWYPPYCSSDLQNMPELHLACCDHLLGVQRAKVRERERLLPEPAVKQFISSLVQGSINSDAEFGQRVLTLMKFNIVPKWLSYNLAASYWRLTGVTAEAAACLRLALADEDGTEYADVALSQLSYLAYSAGNRVDDAINLLHQALDIDDNEPVVHSLLAHYLVVKDNITGAAFHLRRALDMEPNLDFAPDLMKSLLCRLKQVNSAYVKKPLLERPPLSKCAENAKGPRFFCLREDGEEKCYLEERMLPGASTGQDMIMCPACNMPHCLKPPPLASLFISMVDRRPKPVRDTKEKVKRMVKPDLLPPPEQEEVEAEMSLIDASMQPGSLGVNMDQRLVDERPTPPPATNQEEKENEPNGGGRPIIMEKMKEALAPKGNQGLPSEVTPPTKSKIGPAPISDAESPLPDFLPVPSSDMVKDGTSLVVLPATTAECVFWKNKVKIEQPISTYLSVSAKGIDVQDFIDFTTPLTRTHLEPVCPEVPGTMWTMDHLSASLQRHNISDYKPESGLKDAFQKLGGTKESIENVATRVAYAMKRKFAENGDHQGTWVLTTIAALYWRTKGNASMAINCLRHAVNEAPFPMKDLALISLANVYHQSGFLHSALITAGAAMHVSPKFVVVHFTLANIYAALGNWERAMMFYYSTLSLQGNLEAAKERIRAIHCASGMLPNDNQ